MVENALVWTLVYGVNVNLNLNVYFAHFKEGYCVKDINKYYVSKNSLLNNLRLEKCSRTKTKMNVILIS